MQHNTQLEASRRHPLFPTPEEVKRNPDILYSDHLPMMYDIKPQESDEQIRIISWNILGGNVPSGYHTVFSGWETEEQGKKRYTRIAASLAMFANKHQPDVITLQESYTHLFPNLDELLPGYEMNDTGKGLAILVKRAVSATDLVLESVDNIINPAINKMPMQGLCKLTFRRGESTIIINNVHTKYYDTPENHEVFYTDIMQKDKSAISIVVGDTNTRVAPKDDVTSMNITTGVVPMFLNKELGVDENIQMTDFPDAAFYRDSNGVINQADHVVLDYQTGEIFQQAHQNGLQAKWDEFRLLMCLTDYTKDCDKIQGKTVFEFQAQLEKQFPNTEILVRKAAKDNNERGFGFAFKDKTHPLCTSLMPTFNAAAKAEPEFFQNKTYTHYVGRYEQKGHIFFVHKNRINDFLDMRLNWFARHPIATGLIIGTIIVAAIIIASVITWGVGAVPAAIIGLSIGAKIGLGVGLGLGIPFISSMAGLVYDKIQKCFRSKQADVQTEAEVSNHKAFSSSTGRSISKLTEKGKTPHVKSSGKDNQDEQTPSATKADEVFVKNTKEEKSKNLGRPKM